MQRAKVASIDKQRIIDAFEDDRDWLEVGRNLNIKENTIRCIIRRHRLNLNAQFSHGGQRFTKVEQHHRDFCHETVQEMPTMTLREIQEKLVEQFGNAAAFSLKTISRILDGFLYTVKLVRDVPTERNAPRVKQSRHEYARWYLETGQFLQLVFLDECGYNLWTRRQYGRAVRGGRCFRQTGGQRGRNITLCMALSLEGVIYHEFVTESMNRERFQLFLDNLSATLGDTQCTFLMDNAPVHKGVQTAFQSHELRYLPPYSPFLNPIEQ